MGVGKWYTQREKVLGIIRKKIEERGEDNFFVPSAIDNGFLNGEGDD